MWNWYDATAYAGNFFNTSLLAYSGELDPQIQAARIMGQALARTGLPLRHYVGPATAHRYEPATKSELAGHFDALWRTNPARTPGELRFTTFTLRYAEAGWLRLEELGTHWRVATVHARRQPWGAWTLATTNVTALSIDRAAIGWVESESPVLTIDADIVRLAASDNARVALRRRNGTWEPATGEPAGRKRPGVQGPIDDAFLGKFIFVRPTGKAAHPTVGSWVETELTRATNEWRAQFRGEVPVVEDRDLTDRELGEANLILWGDPTSNRVMARLRDQLPIGWDTRRMVVGDESWPAADHVPVLIIPNPWNPQRYVVLNSGFTFWSAGNLSNARQTPRLPDFAVRNVTTGGLIVQAGFFDEAWRLPVAR